MYSIHGVGINHITRLINVFTYSEKNQTPLNLYYLNGFKHHHHVVLFTHINVRATGNGNHGRDK